MKKLWVKVLAGVVIAFILVVVAIPLFVNADTFRPKVQSELTSALGRQVTISHLGLSVLSGSLLANDVAIADDPAFSSAPFFAVRSLHIGVNMSALIFSRNLEVTNFTADSPEIHLISGPKGTWNYSSIGNGSSSSSSGSSSSAAGFSVGQFKINNGTVTVSSTETHKSPFVYDHVNLTAQNVSLSTPMPFEIAANLPAGGSLKLSGTAGPIAQPNAVNTPVQASLSVRHFDPVAAGVITTGEGISTVADIDGNVNSDGKAVTISGKVTAAQLKLSQNGTPAPNPVNVDLNVSDDLGTNSGRVNQIALRTGSVAAQINGTYKMDGGVVTLNLHLAAPGLPVDGLEQLLPAVGVKLPSGSSLHGGTLTANLAITGPLTELKIAGPIEIDNSELAGFDLSSKIEGLMKPGGSQASSGTQIRTIRADVTNTPQSTELKNILGDVPSIGTATGNGTVAASGALNFQMLAKLGATNASSTTGSTSIGAIAGGFLNTASGGGIPLTITGTTSNPSLRLNAGAMLKQEAGGLLGNATKTKSGLSGLAKSFIGK
jgi:AsmA protein